MNIKNIVFDFDGVLIKNSELLLKTHRETIGPFSDEDFKKLFDGNTLHGLSKHKFDNMDIFWEKWKNILSTFLIDKDAKNFILNNNDKNLFIISSNKEEILNKIIKNSDLEKNFSKVLGKNTHSSKVEKFLILKNKYNLKLNQTIFITDSLGDLREVSEFKELKTVGVTWGVHNKNRLKKGDPDYICDSWKEISGKIK